MHFTYTLHAGIFCQQQAISVFCHVPKGESSCSPSLWHMSGKVWKQLFTWGLYFQCPVPAWYRIEAQQSLVKKWILLSLLKYSFLPPCLVNSYWSFNTQFTCLLYWEIWLSSLASTAPGLLLGSARSNWIITLCLLLDFPIRRAGLLEMNLSQIPQHLAKGLTYGSPQWTFVEWMK